MTDSTIGAEGPLGTPRWRMPGREWVTRLRARGTAPALGTEGGRTPVKDAQAAPKPEAPPAGAVGEDAPAEDTTGGHGTPNLPTVRNARLLDRVPTTKLLAFSALVIWGIVIFNYYR